MTRKGFGRDGRLVHIYLIVRRMLRGREGPRRNGGGGGIRTRVQTTTSKITTGLVRLELHPDKTGRLVRPD